MREFEFLLQLGLFLQITPYTLESNNRLVAPLLRGPFRTIN